jgi:sulfatase modifying factor 1
MKRSSSGVVLALACLAFLGCPNPEPLPSWVTSPNIGKLINVPAGTFQRDATATNMSTVSAFHMSEKEITRAQYLAIMGDDPSGAGNSTGIQDPVQNVSWYAALVFCNKLSTLEGMTPFYSIGGSKDPAVWGAIPTSNNAAWDAAEADWSSTGYRLPTEMEWMWAAMGAREGTSGYLKAFAGSTGGNALGDCAWYGFYADPQGSAADDCTIPAGSLDANELGIFDMSGNVWEWCWDKHGDWPTGSVTNYTGVVSVSTSRICHGGSWSSGPALCAVAERDAGEAEPYAHAGNDMGFRVVRN